MENFFKDWIMGVLDDIPHLLAGGESFVLATVVKRSGSAPRSAGAKMVIRKDGSIVGTIGGGALEATVQDLANVVFAERKPLVREFTLTAEDAGRMGMICGGEIEVLIHFVDASDPSNLELYRAILESVKSGRRRWLITELPTGKVHEAFEGDAHKAPSKLRHTKDISIILTDGLSSSPPEDGTLHRLSSRIGAVRQTQVLEHEGKRFLVECLSREGTVYIFGAGHVAQQLAFLAGFVGFHTVVLDDRQEFANRNRFKTADRIVLIESFKRALDGLEIGEDSYLVLVTRGHAHDKTVLRQALKTGAGYIGMIGSRRKREAIYEDLMGEGFSRRELDRVYSPIGADIAAETPEEIAVSIVAELIRVRACVKH